MSTPINSVGADQIVARLDGLRDAIAAVEINGRPLGEAVRYEPGAKTGDPIEVNIAPPEFLYDGNCFGPTRMRLQVFVVAVMSDITVHNLIALERGVADAIDACDPNRCDATVTGSTPGTWRKNGVDYPAYVITCEASI